MTTQERLLFAILVLLVDIIIFFIPILALVAAYVIFLRPPWFRNWVTKLYST